MWTIWLVITIIVALVTVILIYIQDDSNKIEEEQRAAKCNLDDICGYFILALVILMAIPLIYGVWYVLGGFLCWEPFRDELRDDLTIWDFLLPIWIFIVVCPAIVGLFIGKK